jgi:hypothetical protein
MRGGIPFSRFVNWIYIYLSKILIREIRIYQLYLFFMMPPVINKKNLLVKRSRLPCAGKGLFTKVYLPKGARIAEYKGRMITWKEFNADNPFIYSINRKHVIDARPYKKTLARYANDARGLYSLKGVRNNSKYVEDGFKVFIEATKDIKRGEEILVDYGKEYWDAIRYNIKLAHQKVN